MVFFRALFSLILLCTTGSGAWAQLDNAAFRDDSYPGYDVGLKELRLGISAMGFAKNNEYFTDLADGYTLFGYQFNPELLYRPLPELSLQAGVFLRKDFGNDRYRKIAPTFSFIYQKDSFEVSFGNIRGSLNHRLVEPLFDFERVITDRLEYGAQYRLRHSGWWVDAWVSWERMLYRGDDKGEVISGGVSARLPLHHDENWQVELPVQAVVRHRGGQIDTDPRPLSTLVNGALGLSAKRKISEEGLIKYARFQPYYVIFKDFSNEQVLAYEDGAGLYLNATIGMRHFDLMISYWNAEEFIAFQGGDLYQSVSSSFAHPGAIERERELLFIRAMRDIHVGRELVMTLRVEPVIDLRSGQLDYSFGFYLNFRQALLLAKIGMEGN